MPTTGPTQPALPTRAVALGALAVALAAAAPLGCGAEAERAELSQVATGPSLGTLPAGPADTTGPPADTDSADTGGSELLPAGAPCDTGARCATGWCLATREGYRCAPACDVQACAPGAECRILVADDGATARVCVARFATLCQPCGRHDECNLAPDGGADNRCISYGEAGRFCGVACGEDLPPCPEGYRCGTDGQCRLEDGACETCSPLAIATGARTECTEGNPFGTCAGERVCLDAGLSPCDAPIPAAERCNGNDDDCDGATDEGDLSDLCGDYACGPQGCLERCDSDEDCAPGLACDLDDKDGDGVIDECIRTGADGTRCESGEECDSGYCANGLCCDGPDALCCASDDDCAALTEPPVCSDSSAAGCAGFQLVGVCHNHTCGLSQIDNPAGCVDTLCKPGTCVGDVFSPPHRCDEAGGCTQAAPNTPCDDGDPCTFDSCSGELGCLTAPRTGTTDVACYTGPADTRGVGACHDGLLACVEGEPSGCEGEVGPGDEVCDGLDDDCDGATDEGTDASCWPYRCGGAGGCADGCEAHEDCADGAYCTPEGACDATGADGAPCDGDAECASGHCANGVCCHAGACCDDDGDCDAFDAADCSEASPSGCVGTRTEGVCDLTSFACASVTVADPAGCAGQVCDPAGCLDTLSRPAYTCQADGACAATADARECAPFACEDGACRATCSDDAHCAPGATCDAEGQCIGDAPDGSPCSADGQCASGHCGGGVCCAGGLCCASALDCAGLDEPAACEDPEACAGSRVVGVCTGSFQCEATVVDAPEACEGQICGDVSCTNLSGLGTVKEGVTREICDAGGACIPATRDCRDYAASAYCTNNSSFYFWCDGCSPKRTTCVAFSDPCFCE